MPRRAPKDITIGVIGTPPFDPGHLDGDMARVTTILAIGMFGAQRRFSLGAPS